MRTGKLILAMASLVAGMAFGELPSEISVDLKLDEIDYVAGERIRGVVDVKNMAPEIVSCGYPDSRDLVIVEVFRASDMMQLDSVAQKPFVAPFRIASNQGQKLEIFLADYYPLREARRYLARPVLIHGGVRYVGQYRAFDVVPGMQSGGAMQMFANRPGLTREFALVRWSRKGREHLFVTAKDSGTSDRKWLTTDVGTMMKITKPTISILPTGEVIVLHRTSSDDFIRSEFWSMPDAIEFRSRQLVQDPETAGQNRVQEIYKESGGVKAKGRPWWKFW